MKIIRWAVQPYWASFVTWAPEWKKLVVCPLLRMLRDGECYAESLSKRKVAAKSSRGEATPSNAKNGSPSRKKPRLPFAEKTQVGSAPSSSVRVKHLVGADSTKVGGMCGARGVLPEPPTDTLENHDMLREAARTWPSSAERQRDVDIPPQSSSHLHRSRDGDQSGKSAHNLVVESRAVKRGVDLVSLTHLEMWLAKAKKTRESSAWAKGSSVSAVDPKVNKSSPAGDACVFDLLETNFLSNPSSCAELVDHICQVGDLGTFLIFIAETIRNSSAVAPSSAADLVSQKDAYFCLESKNADVSFSYDKLLARFGACHKSAEKSKFEATMNAYKFGYLDCSTGNDSFYAIGDGDIEMLCSDLLPMQSEQAVEEVAEEDEAEDDATNVVETNIANQASGGVENVVDQADAKDAIDQGSPAGVLE
ncbi:unnamed protein product [Prunus armeniaca]